MPFPISQQLGDHALDYFSVPSNFHTFEEKVEGSHNLGLAHCDTHEYITHRFYTTWPQHW